MREGMAPQKKTKADQAAPSPETKKRSRAILTGLRKLYPDAHCELEHRSALELLVATILSAQSTDAMVNTVTPRLFRRYRTPAEIAAADPSELEREIHARVSR